MNLTIISDIHGDYKSFAPDTLKPAEVLLIAGDITNLGKQRPKEVKRAKEWLQSLKLLFPNIFYIFGNHDLGLTNHDFDSFGVTCVQDRVISLGDLKIAGVNLSVCYNLPVLKEHWTNMTDNPALEAACYESLEPCDILLTHSPPSGKLGLSYGGEQCGSEKLKEYIERVQPRLVVCGHIHEAAGAEYIGKSLVINTAQRSYYLEGVDKWSIQRKKNQEKS